MSFGGFGDGSFPNVTALRIIFNDTYPLAPVATWEHTASMAIAGAPRAAGDPILFTDHETGRTFVTQLLGLTPFGSTTEITDDDGRTFTPSEGSGLPSSIDHETFGGGPFAPPLTGGATYKNAVYYCSQSVADATCSISVDGGVTFGPGVPIYTVADCAGLHGHIKVSSKTVRPTSRIEDAAAICRTTKTANRPLCCRRIMVRVGPFVRWQLQQVTETAQRAIHLWASQLTARCISDIRPTMGMHGSRSREIKDRLGSMTVMWEPDWKSNSFIPGGSRR